MLNQVELIGRLGQAPELKYTPGGSAVADLSVATNEKWTDKAGQKQEHCEWHRVIVWEKQAENLAKYLNKGSLVHVSGKLRTRTWDDKEGVKRYTTEIVAHRVLFLEPPKGDRAPAPSDSDAPPPRTGRDVNPSQDDEIPF